MSALVRSADLDRLLPLPAPKVAVTIREGTHDDVPWIDALQKRHGRQLGFMNFATLRGKIALGHVLIAEGDSSPESRVPSPELGAGASTWDTGLGTRDSQPPRLGYVIGNDKYLNRQELGVVYQMAVAPEARRMLVAANLLKALFERSAWGCKLYCCWCAQDIEANRFWESMGFVPLAFRTGGRGGGGKSRVPGPESRGGSGEDSGRGTRDKGLGRGSARTHIFWQKRIREGDTETAWWFPSETRGGAIGEARLVFPIPPGTHWSDAKPMVLPGVPGIDAAMQLTGEAEAAPEAEPRKRSRTRKAAAVQESVAPPAPSPEAAKRPSVSRLRPGMLFAAPTAPPAPPSVAVEPAPVVEAEKPKKKRAPRKNDPRLVAAARELRDRYLEEVNREGSTYALMSDAGKYDVTRQIAAPPPPPEVLRGDAVRVIDVAMLPAA